MLLATAWIKLKLKINVLLKPFFILSALKVRILKTILYANNVKEQSYK